MSGVVEWVIFLALAAVAVMMAAGMLTTMSMYRAGLALMSSFVALAGLFILLDADLLAAIQIMMNVGGMLVMVLFMVTIMMDPGGEMMWEMKRKMNLPGFAAFSMSMPRKQPPEGGRQDGQEQATATDWTCPMHPEVSEPGPGDCPKCGMPLVPRSEAERGPDSAGQVTTYTCPMHPKVRQDHPGQCLICGMDLVPADESQPEHPKTDSATTYTCPMHPEVRQEHPGQCPICGMDLVMAEGQQPAPHQADGATTYTCPMHPEVQQPGPGDCPICGMDLVPAGESVSQSSDQRGTPEHVGVQQSDGSMPGMGTMQMSPRQHEQMMVDMAMSTAQLPGALAIGAGSAVVLSVLVIRTAWPLAVTGPTQDATTMVGELLLSRYMIGFEGAAFLILAGMVGAVIFGKREGGPHQARPTPAADTAAMFTCPMHPEVRQDHPGQCPICGMDLVPAAEQPMHQHEHAARQAEGHAQDDNTSIYTCPMHPEVRQNGPGQCPICGMVWYRPKQRQRTRTMKHTEASHERSWTYPIPDRRRAALRNWRCGRALAAQRHHDTDER